MSILLGIFLVISSVATLILHNVNNRNIVHSLDEMVKSIPFTDKENAPTNAFILKFYDSSKTYDLIYVDNSTFTNEELSELINNISKRPKSSGRIDNVYYKYVEIRNENFLLALDASDRNSQLSETLVKMFLIFLIIYAFLLLIVYIFSFSVFEPIKEAFERQKQFVSNASHELKTPLTIISANADVLKQTQDNQWLNNIKSQTERLEIIVTEMLEMAKIDETPIKTVKEEFNLSDEILQATLPFDSLAFEKGKMLELDVIPDVIYNGDRESVKKIVNILLDNAIKYSSIEGLIKVSLYKKNGKTILSVFNTGSAVPTNQANKIFERFYRFDNSRSRDTGGSGLGLSIAKGIATANKWKISAISKPNEHMIINVIL